jgi:hypothetical protein
MLNQTHTTFKRTFRKVDDPTQQGFHSTIQSGTLKTINHKGKQETRQGAQPGKGSFQVIQSAALMD